MLTIENIKAKVIMKNLYDLLYQSTSLIRLFNKMFHMFENSSSQDNSSTINLAFQNYDNKNSYIIFNFFIEENEIEFVMKGSNYTYIDIFKTNEIKYEQIFQVIYEFLVQNLLVSINTNTKYCFNYNEWFDENFMPIFSKYGINNNYFYFIRKANVLLVGENDNMYYEFAKHDLMKFFKDEVILSNFLDDVKNIYASDLVLNILSK